MCVVAGISLAKVTAKCFECHSLFINLTHRANTHTPQHRQRWAPALHRMLQQKTRDGDWQRDPSSIYGRRQHATG
jgi:hypothetical protein